MRWSLPFPSSLLLLVWSCAETPDPCVPMCDAATALYGGCLETWGVEWTSAGYEDEAHFQESCETWAWTSRLLEEDAGKDGQIDRVCRQRRALFDEGECSDFTGIDWSQLPWEPAEDDKERR